ncbi:hypothetical protein A3860_34265 [Niastella vici]|uniref:Uncharacterized protein n=1 Tax=Niastella vici TaxID=1703345 RepID=A0A1V9FPC4_9BACT|nr:hypothetical protein A3860_34265 [Niastella vici]
MCLVVSVFPALVWANNEDEVIRMANARKNTCFIILDFKCVKRQFKLRGIIFKFAVIIMR